MGSNCSEFCLALGAEAGIIHCFPTSEADVVFCFGERVKTQEEQSQQELILSFCSQPCLVSGTVCLCRDSPSHHCGVGWAQGVPCLGTRLLAMAGSCFVLSPPWADDKQRRAFTRKSLLGKPLRCSIYFAGLMRCALFSLANSSKCTQITLLLSAQVQTVPKASS